VFVKPKHERIQRMMEKVLQTIVSVSWLLLCLNTQISQNFESPLCPEPDIHCLNWLERVLCCTLVGSKRSA
jgi:hypothetical protein